MEKPFTRGDRVEDLHKEVAYIKVVLDQHSEQLNRLEDHLKLLPGLIADVAFLRSLYKPSPGSNPDLPSTSDNKRKALISLPPYPSLKTFDSHTVSSWGNSPRPFGQANDQGFTGFQAAEYFGDGRQVGLGRFSPLPRGDRHCSFDFRQQQAWDSDPRSELPMFDGEDWERWIKNAERFLRLTQSHPVHKAQVISDYMTEKVWDYYEWITEKEPTNPVPFWGQKSNTSQSTSLICTNITQASADQIGFLNKPLPPTTTAPPPPLSRGDGGATRGAITQAERLRRREANLCYRCGERWEPGHRCKPL